MLSNEELAYLAGIIDGEGCFFIDFAQKQRLFRPHLYIYNTSPRLMEWLKSRLTGWVQTSNPIPSEKKHLWKHSYRFEVPISSLRVLLPTLVPYLVIKKPHAKLLLEYFALVAYGSRGYPPRVLGIYKELKLLNKKGPQSESDVIKKIEEVEAKIGA